MRKQMYFLQSICLLIYCINAEEYKLQFQPFGEVIYYCSICKDSNTYCYPNLTLRTYITDSIIDNNNFKYDVLFFSNNSSPPNDKHGMGSMPLSNSGIKEMWKDVKFEFPTHMPIDAEMVMDWPIVFPYYPKSQFKVGEVWKLKLLAPITFTNAIDMQLFEKVKAFFKSKTVVILKFEAVKQMLGFQCAEISYLMTDSLKSDTGEMLHFICNGTVFFAIKEGFIVSDIMNIKHDQLNGNGHVDHVSIKKKLRMLYYEPYSKKK